MPASIPLIRTAALIPMVRWMETRRLDVDRAFAAVDLEWYPRENPSGLIPLRNAALFLRNLSRSQGPDTPFRIVGRTGLFELAMLARVALGTRTPQDALGRIASAMPFHCSHEVMSISSVEGECVIRDELDLDVDDETRHFVQQYFVAMVGLLFGLTTMGETEPSFISMQPHPKFGFDHLDRWFSSTRIVSDSRSVKVHYPRAVAEGQFRSIARDRLGRAPQTDWAPLIGDGRLSTSVRSLLPGILPTGRLTIDRIAGYAGMSRRTFQRRLRKEGYQFSNIVEDVRKEIGLKRLMDSSVHLHDLTKELGYSGQSTTTRAFRRWTGRAPQSLRSSNGSAE